MEARAGVEPTYTDLQSVLMLSKFKSAAEGSVHLVRDYFGGLGKTYMERMDPFHRYVEIYRAKGGQ